MFFIYGHPPIFFYESSAFQLGGVFTYMSTVVHSALIAAGGDKPAIGHVWSLIEITRTRVGADGWKYVCGADGVPEP